jgi:hypothetical protein
MAQINNAVNDKLAKVLATLQPNASQEAVDTCAGMGQVASFVVNWNDFTCWMRALQASPRRERVWGLLLGEALQRFLQSAPAFHFEQLF